jgi:class 3 adenylate cyclase
VALVDEAGIERLHVSRIDLNREAGQKDRSDDPAVSGARAAGVWYGPVTYYHESEPFMVMSVAGNRKAAGIAVAEINLKLVRDVIAGIRVGNRGRAFVTDQLGRLVAHPDLSKVLQGTNDEVARRLRQLRDEIEEAGGRSITTVNGDDEAVVASMEDIPGVGWTVFVEQPQAEAFAPIYAALWRTGGLLLGTAAGAAGLAYWLARRMSGPIRILEDGAEKIGAGQFEHRINIATGDELERLALRFNEMAQGLATSRERMERIARLKRFLAPQVAELVEGAGDEDLLVGKRMEVVVVFCDLRGFTAFTHGADPEEIMRVLGEYYQVLGAVVTRFEATVTNFSADGLMVLVNAPVPCAEPALRAVDMAIAMQEDVQRMICGWCARGHSIGFGIGIAMGWATVGRIGYEGRHDYTAIGNVANLASRLCSSADDQQILIDHSVAHTVRGKIPMVALGARDLKGFDEQVAVYDIGMRSVKSDVVSDPNEIGAKS